MPNPNTTDPYLYPGTQTLINHFGITDEHKLQELEGFIFALKSHEPLPLGNFDYAHLKAIHFHFFGEIYPWAGEERLVDIAKANSYFAHTAYITHELDKLFAKLKQDNYLGELSRASFCEKLSYYFNEINAAHPFREGNGRTLRAFCDVLSEQAGYTLEWQRINQREYIHANIEGFINGNYDAMASIFKKIAQPIVRKHSIEGSSENLTAEIKEHLKVYVKKQIELTELVQQKTNVLISDPDYSQTLTKQALILNEEIIEIAKTLMNDKHAQVLLKQPILISLHQQGGFAAIQERLARNQIATADVLAVLRHAKNNVQHLTQSLSEEQKYSKHF